MGVIFRPGKKWICMEYNISKKTHLGLLLPLCFRGLFCQNLACNPRCFDTFS